MFKLGKLILVGGLATLMLTGCGDNEATNEKETPKETEATAEWSYEGETGPSHWEELGFIEGGKEQSPINIVTSDVQAIGAPWEEAINYAPTSFKVFNNGHTIEAVAETENNTVTIDDEVYTLEQFHFHTPSEHQINGENADMELHLVNKDEEGNIAVLGVLIHEGAENAELAKMWSPTLPTEVTSEEEAVEITEQINPMMLLPVNQAKYEYQGSLTTPPATENVKWFVYEQPIEMSKAQIEQFQALFKDDHRPVQPINDRDVYQDAS